MIAQLGALVLDSFREARARKVFFGMFLNGTLAFGVLSWYIEVLSRRGPYSNLTLLAQADARLLDDGFASRMILGTVSPWIFWSQLLFGFVSLMGLIAPLLSAERNASLAALPVPRPLIVTGRFLGCLAVALPGVVYPIIAVWIACGVRTGVWHPAFLVAIPVTVLAIAALLGTVTLLQTLTDSPAVVFAVMATCGVLAVAASSPDHVRDMTGSALLASVAGRLEPWLPQTANLAQWLGLYVRSGVLTDTLPLWSTGAFAAGAVAAASMLFIRKEF